MTVITVISVAVASFLSGFMLGSFNFPKRPSEGAVKTANIGTDDLLDEEYRNFLSYDGTQQI